MELDNEYEMQPSVFLMRQRSAVIESDSTITTIDCLMPITKEEWLLRSQYAASTHQPVLPPPPSFISNFDLSRFTSSSCFSAPAPSREDTLPETISEDVSKDMILLPPIDHRDEIEVKKEIENSGFSEDWSSPSSTNFVAKSQNDSVHSQCDYSTNRRSSFISHETVCVNKKPFKCDKCHYSTTIEAYLSKHKTIHSKEKPFKCDQCHYSTTVPAYLFKHKTIIHLDDKPYKCNQCDYSTNRKSSLVRHGSVHAKEKPFKCNQCNYSTNRKSCLVRHETMHVTYGKPFKCNECNYSSSNQKCIEYHLNNPRIVASDKMFQCNQCHFSSDFSSNLARHLLVRHSKYKSYKCDQCDYSTTTSPNLKLHKKVHWKNKPFKCDQCAFSTIYKGNLKMHRERIHESHQIIHKRWHNY